MRLAQQEVKVNVVGDDKVGHFETVNAAAYIVIHEQDAAQFVRNTKRLQSLLKDADIAKLVKNKGL